MFVSRNRFDWRQPAAALVLVALSGIGVAAVGQPPREITPVFHPLQTINAKSDASRARKPSTPPHLPGPVVELRAQRADGGQIEWRCDADHSSVGSGLATDPPPESGR